MVFSNDCSLNAIADKTQISPADLFKTDDAFQISQNLTLPSVKMRYKHCYKLFNENCINELTVVQAWKQVFPDSLVTGRPTFKKYASSLNIIN